MYRNLLNLLVLAVLLPSCSDTSPHISVVCEENNVGNCIVKWEMAPLVKGNVKVYASTNPEHIPEDVPVAIANISDLKMTVITTDPTQRYYYTLVFGDKYRVKTATRNINIPGIQNFRDLGESALGHAISLCRNRQTGTVLAQRAQEHRHKDYHRPALIR